MISITASECAYELLKKDKFVILIHSNPDGDCIGSGVALAYTLERLGKTAKVVCPHTLPERLAFMTENVPESLLSFGLGVPDGFDDAYIVSTDIASPQLLGLLSESYSEKINMCIDHHMINTIECDCILRDSESASCGEIILSVIDSLEELAAREGQLLDVVCANLLYTAISSDSGSFKYANTTAGTLRSASRLKRLGADSERISRLLFETRSLASFKLMGIAIAKTEFLADGRLAYCILLDEELSTVGATKEDCEGITQIFREVAGVEMSIFGKQYTDKITGENCVKYSLRSVEKSCADVCKTFGGGGHYKAAGCTIKGVDCDTARKMIVERAVTEISE